MTDRSEGPPSELGTPAFVQISKYIVAPPARPVPMGSRFAEVRLVGGKAIGLAIIPRPWTPPFLVITADAYAKWARCDTDDQSAFLAILSRKLIEYCGEWSSQWPCGLALRSSAVAETIRERGAYESTQTTADYGVEVLSGSISQIYSSFRDANAPDGIAVIVQARADVSFAGHMSNERRVSKTVNQWMWEADEPWEGTGRFNSQRAHSPPPNERLRVHTPQTAVSLQKLFQRIGRWCTHLQNGPCHIEWGLAGENLWIFQIDFEDDQPDTGVDPSRLLCSHEIGPSKNPPQGSPFKPAVFDGQSGWPKIDKVRHFIVDRVSPYPTLYFATGAEIENALASGRDVEADIRYITSNVAVCRTECINPSVDRLNLPRTDTVSAEDAVAFMRRTLVEYREVGVHGADLCFIVHKFIPAKVAAWALAFPDRQIVLVDALWGLPDGLQFLSHDTFEYDVKRQEMSSEILRHKPIFLQEAQSGVWQLVNVSRRVTRHRSLSAPDLREVAETTHRICQRLGKPIQVMWFCEIDDRVGVGRNIPWFIQDASDVEAKADNQVAPSLRRSTVRNIADLDTFPIGDCVMELEPEAGLFRSNEFLQAIGSFAVEHSVPVMLRGSILGHAFYTLQRRGVTVIGTDSGRTRSRRRQNFAKLVRDDIPQRIKEQGELVVTARIAKSQARVALISKLYEEGQELLAARSPEDVKAELADIVEVVRSLCLATGVDWSDVERVADAKRKSRGSFENNVVLLATSWPTWKERPRADSNPLIDLRDLARSTSDGSRHVVNFSGLIAATKGDTIHLQDGRKIRVRLSAKGLEVDEGDIDSVDGKQLAFDLDGSSGLKTR